MIQFGNILREGLQDKVLLLNFIANLTQVPILHFDTASKAVSFLILIREWMIWEVAKDTGRRVDFRFSCPFTFVHFYSDFL